ncbi:Nucleosome assembly protein 1.2 [Zostera marina]|uniref:Nucleosome assembly protein 1.2 n=1 Tax=Zostera marina TaxID=29655 RepID=A0A0K9NSI5_ZOSMR|nr:Nucleosome assembly protein 1.2 [Zostera marina]
MSNRSPQLIDPKRIIKFNDNIDREFLKFGSSDVNTNREIFKELMRQRIIHTNERKMIIVDLMTENVQKRVDVLKEIQNRHDDLKIDFQNDLQLLKEKYNKMYQPLYKKRSEIVNGFVEVDGITKTESSADVGIPDFWLTALTSNEIISWEINDNDKEALKYLKDIKWQNLGDDKRGFKLEFYFDVNPFFSNSILTKTYYVSEDEDEDVLEKATGTVIDWYPGKNLLEIKEGSDYGKEEEEAEVDAEKEDIEFSHYHSFFKFFSPMDEEEEEEDEVEDEVEDEEDDDSAVSDLQNSIEHDFEIGYIIKENIIPQAVAWYTGEAIESSDVVEDYGADSGDVDDVPEAC